jgi:hypothetical protein
MEEKLNIILDSMSDGIKIQNHDTHIHILVRYGHTFLIETIKIVLNKENIEYKTKNRQCLFIIENI